MLVTRRLLLRWLPALPPPGFLARPAVARPAPRGLLMNQLRVAGLAYDDVEDAIRRMRAGDPPRLVAEPTNPTTSSRSKSGTANTSSATFPAATTGISAGCRARARCWPARCGKPTRTPRAGKGCAPGCTRSAERAAMTAERARYRARPTDGAESPTTDDRVALAHTRRQGIPDESREQPLARLPERLRRFI